MTDTTSTTEACQVLPVDTRGRVRVSAQRREALLAQFDKSGMTGKRFAAWAGINYQTLCGWLQRRRKAGSQPPTVADPRSLQWVEATLEGESRQAPARGVLVVHLPGGAWMEIGDGLSAALAAELLRNLAAAGGN
jgi:acetyl esterase/lipase